MPKAAFFTTNLVSVASKYIIEAASRTFFTLHSLTTDLHLFTKHILILMTPEAEKFNGWAAMLGFVAAFGAYATTGQIIPGIF